MGTTRPQPPSTCSVPAARVVSSSRCGGPVRGGSRCSSAGRPPRITPPAAGPRGGCRSQAVTPAGPCGCRAPAPQRRCAACVRWGQTRASRRAPAHGWMDGTPSHCEGAVHAGSQDGKARDERSRARGPAVQPRLQGRAPCRAPKPLPAQRQRVCRGRLQQWQACWACPTSRVGSPPAAPRTAGRRAPPRRSA